MGVVSISSLLPPVAAAQEGSEQGWSGIRFLKFILIYAPHCSRNTHGTDQLKQKAQRKQNLSQSNGSASSLTSLWLWKLWEHFFQKCFSTEPALKQPDTQFSTKPPLILRSRFNKVPTYALNFGLFCTLVKQMGREYFCPQKSNLSQPCSADDCVGGQFDWSESEHKESTEYFQLEPVAEQHRDR